MISCIIVDDEQHAIDLLTLHISKTETLDLKFSTTNSIKAFEYLQKNKTDLVFLDIHMPELDGMQFLKLLKGKSKAILTTAYADYALEGYELDIVDYLLKPITFERFLKASQKAIDLLSPSNHIPSQSEEGNANDEFIFVKTERGKMLKVLLKDIQYIEGMGNYLSIQTSSAKIITLSTLKELEQKLPLQQFIRIHHSYVIPVNKITAVEGNQVQIEKHTIPIGDVYKHSFQNLVEKHLLNTKK